MAHNHVERPLDSIDQVIAALTDSGNQTIKNGLLPASSLPGKSGWEVLLSNATSFSAPSTSITLLASNSLMILPDALIALPSKAVTYLTKIKVTKKRSLGRHHCTLPLAQRPCRRDIYEASSNLDLF
jgi:hypothetical protein